jgi:eukaryotic-like serine/threonine-protein kinase
MSADPADRTATLQPSLSPAPASESSARDDASDDALPIDDPDRYDQVAEHARGGLGRVVRAVDKRLGRTVAVKELLRHDEVHEAQFVREALITARLEHPGIVPVHEAGRWPNGSPYYVMKLVEGRTLKELFASKPSLTERLALLQHVIAIADAVGYAHSEGVIHRDLKPSNVIVGEFGETIVIDWGLARDTKRDVPEVPAELLVQAKGSGVSTISGRIVGTPAYMAPEQARGELVDERADVYAIGAVLYELLAGKAPHADETPQAVLDRVIAGPPAPLSDVAPDAPGELADIVRKAMARQPVERYPNGTALAEDLRRFQTGKLVSAHSYTTYQLVRKKLAQHRGVVVVGLIATVALAGIGVESFRTVVAERDIARSERVKADVARKSAEDRKRQLVLVQAETSLRKDPTAALAWLKLHPVTDADRTQVVDVIDEALALGAARHVFRPGDWVFDAIFTPDGKTVIAGVRDGRIRAYDLATGTVRELGKSKTACETLAMSPDGATLVTASSFGDVVAWPIKAGGTQRVLAERGQAVSALRFDSAGTSVIVEREGATELIGLDGTTTKVGPESTLRSAVAEDNSERRVVQVGPNEIATLGTDGALRTIATTERLIHFLDISPDGETVVAFDGHAVWGVPFAGGALTKIADYDATKLVDVVWSPDRSTFALLGMRPDIVLVERATGKLRELRGHTDALYTAEFSRDGRSLLTASDDGTARVWNVADGSALVLRGHDDDVYRARWSPDEKSVATASLDSSVRVWPIDRSGAAIFYEGGDVLDLEVDHDLATVRTTRGVSRWSLETGTRERLFERGGLGIGVPSPDGEMLVVPSSEWSLDLRHRNGKTLSLRGHHAFITHVEWSRDSKVVFSSSSDGTLRAWDPMTGTSKLLVNGKTPVRGFAVARDGRLAAQIGDDATLIKPDGTSERLGISPAWCGMGGQFERVRDRLLVQTCNRSLLLVDGTHAIELPTDDHHVVRATVSPDGSRVAGAMSDRTVRLWDSSGKLISVLRGHSDMVMDVAFSPDGSQLASASYDKTIRIWELTTGRYRVLRGHTRAVDRVAWRSPRELVTGSYDGTLRLWPVPAITAPTQDEISRRLDAATSAAIDAQNRATTSAGNG